MRITEVNTERVGRAVPYMVVAVMFIKTPFLKIRSQKEIRKCIYLLKYKPQWKVINLAASAI